MADIHDHKNDFVPFQYEDMDGNWQVKIATRAATIHSEEKQNVFLDELANHGRMMSACKQAGVTYSSVRRLRAADKDFDEAVIDAERCYHDRLIAHHQNLVCNGTTKENYDRNGNLVSSEQVSPVRLIELELKKHDDGSRDKKEVDLKVSGGVLLAPSDVKDIEEWEKKFASDAAKQIEGEVVESEKEK